MDLKKAYLGMIRAYQGGWDAMAAALGITRSALENRIYERKGQSLQVETALQMQAFSETALFATAVARLSGGTFVKLPSLANVGRADLLEKFNELYVELGDLSQTFKRAIDDDEIDDGERINIEVTADQMHRKLEELLAVMFRVYCRPGRDMPESTIDG